MVTQDHVLEKCWEYAEKGSTPPLKRVIFARHRERPKGVVAIQNCFTPLDYFTPFAIVKVM
jgi:hypothetical protein